MTPEGGWKLNVGAFERHYRPRGWLTRGALEGFGYQAVQLGGDGRPRGRPLVARTLDELADLIDDAIETMPGHGQDGLTNVPRPGTV